LHGKGETEGSKRRGWGREHGTIMGDYRIDRLLDPVEITG